MNDPDENADSDPETSDWEGNRETQTSLEELRTEIREIDREIVELVAQRTYVAEDIAEIKAQRGMPTTDERQERQVMSRAGENADQFDVDANLVKAIFRLLIELNKVEQ
ncbi:MAG: chorismate mutase, partial [Halobacteriales archaeon]